MPYFNNRDGQRLHYHEMGRGPVCILIHGFGMHGALWKTLAWPLSRRYRFVMPDLRGFNGSKRAGFDSERSIFEHFADDLADLINHIGEERVHIMGYSMGGATAMCYQMHYGTERVQAYAQIDQIDQVTNHSDWQWGLYGERQTEKLGEFQALFDELDSLPHPEQWDRLPPSFQNKLLTGFTDFVASTAARKSWKWSIEKMGQSGLIKQAMPSEEWPAFSRCMRDYTCTHVDLSPAFDGYDRPFWVLTGSDSELYDARGQTLMAEKVTTSQQVLFHGAGHLLPFEKPLQFVRTLNAFMQSGSS